MLRFASMLLIISLLACSRPGGPPSVNGDPDAEWPDLAELDDEIVAIMDSDRIAGLAACLVEDGALAWCGGYGDANADSGLKATPSTPFLLASVSKAVTAVAVMQVVEDGGLDLDAPVNDLLSFTLTHPDSPGTDITTRHLMTHTSGIVDNWDVLEAHYVTGDSNEELGTFLEGYLAVGGADYDDLLNFHEDGVGQAFEYSNVGAALAGHMVEVATGTAFDDFCDQRIFEPLELNAGWHLADFDADEVAAPTQVSGGEFEVLDHFGFPDYPDGQLRADARSMARFVAMMASDGGLDGTIVLDADTVASMLEVQVPELDEDQGLMWYRWNLDEDTVVGHNGGETGTSTEILFRVSDGRGAVVLMNSEGRRGTLEAVEMAMFDAADGL